MNMLSIRTKQAGFTLIELIVVIVILGILAATALPKMGNLTADARAASVKAAAASVKAVVGMAHAKFLAAGSPSGADTPVTFETVTVTVDKTTGYPNSATDVYSAAGLDTTSTGDYDNNSGVVSPKNAKSTTNCALTYNPATVAGGVTAGSVTVVVSDC